MNVERYGRHALIDWFDQAAVASERVLVVGAGAVGNEVLKNLVLLGTGEIHVFDLDVVEVHNLTRSVLFREGDVGRRKVDCAAERACELDPAVRVVPHHGDFWDTLDFGLLRSATGVFCCVDNFEARLRLNRLCALAGVPLVNTGIDSRLGVVEAFPFGPGQAAACYECALPPSAYAAIARRYSCGWLRRVAQAERKVPTTILTSSAVASLAVSVHLRRVTGEKTAASARYFLDTFTGQTTQTELERRPECPGCGDLREPRLLVRAAASIETLVGSRAEAGAVVVRGSDRVLTSVRCRKCETGEAVVFERAERFDERFATCPSCGEAARELRIDDQWTLGELANRWRGRALPVKFVVCDLATAQVVVELPLTSEIVAADVFPAKAPPPVAEEGRASHE